MRRVLIEWRGIRIWSYPALLYLGFLLGMLGQNRAAHAAGLDPAQVWSATLMLIPLALIGSRALFVASHWPLYRSELRRIFDRSEGGMAMYGGLLLVLAGSVPLLSWLELPFWQFWDVSAFCISIGMFFARVGCLLNGCCGGRPSDGVLALRLPDVSGCWQRRLPTQGFEAALALGLLGGSVWIWPALPAPGALFLLVVLAYGLGRLALQPTRIQREWVGPLDLHQAISAGLVVLSLAGLALDRH